MKKILAFTLAETLIVMGIIGIVSALTLPNLNSSTGEKEKVAKVKKIYRDLNDAYGRAIAVYGPVEEWFTNDTTDEQETKRFGERFTEFLKTSKITVNGGDYGAILADGTQIHTPNGVDLNTSKYYNGLKFVGVIVVDIDGPNKGKNINGQDVFYFDVMSDGTIVPDGYNAETGSSPCDNSYGHYCTRWVIENDNMDYLKCFDKLKWGQQTSCK